MKMHLAFILSILCVLSLSLSHAQTFEQLPIGASPPLDSKWRLTKGICQSNLGKSIFGQANESLQLNYEDKSLNKKMYLVFSCDEFWHRIMYGDFEKWTKSYGSAGDGNAGFYMPYALTMSSYTASSQNRNQLFVLDKLNKRIQVLNMDLQFSGSGGSGNSSLSYAATISQSTSGMPLGNMSDICRMRIGGSEYLIVCETGKHRILFYELSTGSYAFRNAYGTQGGGSGNFYFPESMTATDFFYRNIFVEDRGNNRIVKLLPYRNNDGTISLTWINTYQYDYDLASIEADGFDNLYIADRTNHRVLKTTRYLSLLKSYGTFGTGNIVGTMDRPRHFSDGYYLTKYSDGTYTLSRSNLCFMTEEWADNTGGALYERGTEITAMTVSVPSGNSFAGTYISFFLTEVSYASIKIERNNSGGWTLVKQYDYMPLAGANGYSWNGKDNNGIDVPMGQVRFTVEVRVTWDPNATPQTRQVVFTPSPPVITGFTTSPSLVCPGGSGTVTCNATGGELSYSWTINSKPSYITVTGIDGNHLYFVNTSPGMMASASGTDGIEADMFKVTCTASNAFGSVSQQYYPGVSTNCGGGCPFVFVNTDSGYAIDNNILHRSEFAENAGVDITDVYKLNVNPKKQNGKYRLQIKELNNDHSYFDRIRLYSVDHPAGTELGVTENNDLVLYVPDGVLSTNNALLNSTNITDQIQYSPSGKGVTGIPLDFLNADFMGSSLKPNSLFENLKLEGNPADSVALITDPQADGFVEDPPKQMAGSVEAGGSEMASGSISRPFARREKKSVVIVPLTQGMVPDSVNVTWFRDYDIRYAAVTPILYGGYIRNNLQLLSAEHSVYGNVKNRVTSVDGQHAEMDSLQNIVLTFSAGGNVPTGYVRSIVLETIGRYDKPGESSKANQSNLSKVGVTELGGIPTKFELKGNYPNPFNPSTTIEFAVPIETEVTVTIYDVLGRTVGTLVKETKPAGTYQITFDASGLASGLYIYRMTAGDYSNSKKMLLIK